MVKNHKIIGSILLFISLLISGLLYIQNVKYPIIDDSYITFRFSKNLAAGEGAVFNSGEKVEGYTSFLWMILMAAIIKIGLDVEIWSVILGMLFAAGISIYIFLKISCSIDKGKYNFYISFFSAFLLTTEFYFIRWATSGLETILFIFLILIFYDFFMKAIDENNQSNILFAGLSGGLLFLTRPEAPMIIACSSAYYGLIKLKNKDKNPILTPIKIYSISVAIAAVHILWRCLYYHEWLPNTYYCKVEYSLKTASFGLLYLKAVFLKTRWYIPFIFFLIPPYRRFFIDPKNLLWIGTGFLFCIYYIIIGGDVFQERFVLPSFILFLVAGLSSYNSKTHTYIYIYTILYILLFSCFTKPFIIPKAETNYINASIGGTRAHRFTGKWLKDNFSPQTYIATPAAGLIPFFSDLKTLDMHGLCEKTIARMPATDKFFIPGHNKFNMDYVVMKRPDLLLFSLSNNYLFGYIDNLLFQEFYLLGALINTDKNMNGESCIIIPEEKRGITPENRSYWNSLDQQGYGWAVFYRNDFIFNPKPNPGLY